MGKPQKQYNSGKNAYRSPKKSSGAAAGSSRQGATSATGSSRQSAQGTAHSSVAGSSRVSSSRAGARGYKGASSANTSRGSSRTKQDYAKQDFRAEKSTAASFNKAAAQVTSAIDSSSNVAGNLIEGRHAVYEALVSDGAVPLDRILMATGIKEDESITQIIEAAKAAGVPIKMVPRADIEKKSAHGSHQGILAYTKKFEYTPLNKIIARTQGKENALIIALDHVTDPGNFGAIARSAEIVGASGIVVCAKRSAPVTAVAHKASAGALSHVPVAREANLVASLSALKDAGFWVAGASEKATQNVWEAPLEGRIVLVMGSEGSGLARLTQENCDFLVSLPQAGKIGSLNVAQATTAIAYEWLRRNTNC